MAVAFDAAARPVSHEGAMRGAEDWISRPKARRHLRPPSGDVRTVSVDGTNLFHLVALEGGGFVTVSADDSTPAIRGFSASGEIPEYDENNPLWTLLTGKKDRRRSKPRMEKRLVKLRRKSSAAATSRQLLGASGDSHITSVDGIDDLRVAPLVKSTWNQQSVGGKNVYNYYTPNGYPCGCVATAMAQLMRYHKYPSGEVAQEIMSCKVGGSDTNLTMKGGVYDWETMPLTPTESITDSEREMIGRICYDAGVAMRMQYGSAVSAAYGGFEPDPLKNVFGYSNAEAYWESNPYDNIQETSIYNGILANLDAGCPVLLGIGNKSGGHAIIADGYGFNGGVLFCHLNMGWGSNSDYWYAIPKIDTDSTHGTFDVVNSLVYNIFPEAEGQIVSGRIVDPFGNPATNALVTATVEYGSNSYVTNTTTSATGVYSLIVPSEACTSRIVAVDGLESWASTNTLSVATTASASPYDFNFETGGYRHNEISIGNSWGNDLVLVQTNVVAASELDFSPATGETAADDGFSLTFNGPSGAWYTVWYSELLPPSWNVYTNIQVSVTGEGSVCLPIDPLANSRFFCITPENFTP
ncbi:MAG: C10 family peptidase [Kiritimatiellae bacterium]|nr:C10 family peptidase [Kiritimatiellia bacterium]